MSLLYNHLTCFNSNIWRIYCTIKEISAISNTNSDSKNAFSKSVVGGFLPTITKKTLGTLPVPRCLLHPMNSLLSFQLILTHDQTHLLRHSRTRPAVMDVTLTGNEARETRRPSPIVAFVTALVMQIGPALPTD